MLISYEKEFLFIHIYKTAGTSVRDFLVPHSRLIDRLVYQYRFSSVALAAGTRLLRLPDDGNRRIAGVNKHGTAREARAYLGPARFDRYFKFSFVRNPYDLMVSLYLYIREGKAHRDHELAKRLTFGQFLRHEIDRGTPRQVDFLCDESGRMVMDFVGRFERLDEDLAAVARRLAIPALVVPHSNPTRGRAGRAFESFYDPASRAAAAAYFAADFDTFGYER